MPTTINGTSNGETLNGTTGDDIINGLGGNDTLRAGDGPDQLFGGDGDDNLFGGTGIDFYDGGTGSDYLGADAAALTGVQATYTGVGTGTYVDVYGNTESFVNIEQIGGTTLNDTVTFGAGDNHFTSFGGADTVNGGDGFDQIGVTNSSGNGFNSSYNPTSGINANFITGVITGGYAGMSISMSGVERVRGTNFGDTFIGGNNDHAYYSFRGLGGADTYIGGTSDNDQVDYRSDAGAGGTLGVTVDLAAGTATDGFGNAETLSSIENIFGTNSGDTITGNASNNNLGGMAGNDTLNGGDGDDFLNGGNGVDTLNGGNGSDWVSNYRDVYYDDATSGVTVNLATQTQIDAFGNTDTLTSIENAAGTQLVDHLTGNSGDNIFRGYDGNDIIDGGAGIDTVEAYGRSTWETWQDEATVHNRGTQAWTVNVADGSGTVIDQFGNTDTVTSIERFRGTMWGDSFTGGSGDQYFSGLGGNDTFTGGAGSDWVEYRDDASFGGVAGVTVNLVSGTATDGFGHSDTLSGIENIIGTGAGDTITGNSANNRFVGLEGNDTMSSGAGNDTLEGDAGTNTLNGGGGFDRAYYGSSSGTTITRNGDGSVTISGSGFTDTLVGVEVATFFDQTVALRERARTDMNGDGGSDLILQSGNQLVAWTVQNGTAVSGSVLGAVGGSWSYGGTGDFNGDGINDLLVQNGGTLAAWTVQNGTVTAGSIIGFASGYSFAGTGDFNGDGTTDVLLQNGTQLAQWTVQDGVATGGSVIGYLGGSWAFAGTGDFNGDGTTDILLNNNGTLAVWNIVNGALTGGTVAGYAAGWTVAGTGDFNRDGTTDILLRNGSTLLVWNMQNNVAQSGNVIGFADGAWSVVGTGDYNADGTADIALQNGSTIIDWLMTNGTIGSSTVIGNAGTYQVRA